MLSPESFALSPSYTGVMRRSRLLAGLAAALFASAVLAWAHESAARAEEVRADLAQQLRYIGRDTSTGLAAPVGDRFIAEAERSFARYGKDEGTPVPPPPVNGADIASISIARLGMTDAPVVRFGLDAFGRLEVPQDANRVGWNPAYNSLPGEGGSTFFAAHFEYGGRPGVFNKLSTMANGDEVEVTLSDGSRHRYRVTSTVDYNLASIDMGAILFGREGRESVTLMTCSGPPGADGYPERTVVLAERID